MRLSVVIPTWRRPEDLARCLDGLAGQSRTPDEVVVIVRSEDAETRALLGARHGDGLAVLAREIDRPGVVEALRAGIEASDGDVVAITDDDSVPRPDWLERIERAFEAEASIGGVGGRDLVHQAGGVDGGAGGEVGRIGLVGRALGNHHLGAGPARDVDVLKGVNMAFRREAIRPVDFGHGLRGGGAQVHWELDLCLAVSALGWRLLYDPEVIVDHYPAQRFGHDQRDGRSLIAMADEVFNLSLVLLRRLPAWRGAVALGYGLLVGTRKEPGLVTALEGAARGRPVGAALRACEQARLRALRAAFRRA